MNRVRYSVLALVAVAWNGCSWLDSIGGRKLKSGYCADHPDDVDCRQEFPDADNSCHSNASCTAPAAGICDLAGSHMCVQCIAPDQVSACAGTSPVCGGDHVCRACQTHADCPLSNVCLADGSCAAEDQVAYVDPDRGSGNACTLAVPCKTIADALGTARMYAKLTGMIDEQVQVDQSITFVAATGAMLTSKKNGLLLEIRGASRVDIYDLTITGASGPSGIGISLPAGNSVSLGLHRTTITNNTGGGIVATGGNLTISQSTISGNTAGGISLSGSQFDITNSVIASNGGPATAIGGVRFDQTNTGIRRFEFNTVTNNNGSDGESLGVVCTLVGQPVTFGNNIVYANQIGGTRTQVGGANCIWQYSDIGPATVAGTGNINSDPLFVDRTQGNFHLQATSPAKDKAAPASSLNVDIDGDARPQGEGRDMGADEVK